MVNIVNHVLASLVALSINRHEIHQPLTDNSLTFVGHSSIAQSFISQNDNLNSVSICLRNPGRTLMGLEFDLHEGTISAQPVRSIVFSGGNVSEQDCTRFQFVPIQDSAQKTYVAAIKSLESEKEKSHFGMYFESYRGQDYVDGNTYVDGQLVSGDLHFKTTYREKISQTILESWRNLLRRIRQDLLFFIPYSGAVVYMIFILKRTYRKS